MRNDGRGRGRTIQRIAIFLLVLVAMGTGSFLSSAHAPATAVTIVNNSSRDVRHVYLSSTSDNNWGPDQLNPSIISAAGGSFTLNDVACNAADLKVIAEDQDGCFVYKVITCGESTTWTITNESTRDCGN